MIDPLAEYRYLLPYVLATCGLEAVREILDAMNMLYYEADLQRRLGRFYSLPYPRTGGE